MSAHYIYAQGRAGKYEELTEALSYIRERASEKSGHEGHVWNGVGIPLLTTCKELASCNYSVAAALFLLSTMW